MIVRYRALRSSWGIAIDLVVTKIEANALPAGASRVSDRVGLLVTTPSLGDGDAAWVAGGLSLVADRLRPPVGLLLVVVSDVTFNPADFQPEGLAAAMIQWAREELGLPAKDAVTGYDKDAGRYVFDLEGAAAVKKED